MRIRTIANVATLSLLFSLGQVSASIAGDHPTKEMERIVSYTRFLEAHPLHAKAPDARSAILALIEQAPAAEVKVVACDILGPLPRQHLPYGDELVLQSLFGNASYQIEHPDKKDDMLSVQVAGIESALKAYALIVAVHPQARIPYFDDLLKRDADGTLSEFIAPVVSKKCSISSGNGSGVS